MSNMYAEVDKPNINPLAGKCLHGCSYCYVQQMARFPGVADKYAGEIRLDEKVLSKSVKGGTRFLCSCNDLFAEGVPDEMIMKVIKWAARQESVTWLIQTKNPNHELFRRLIKNKPDNFRLGITLETNRHFTVMGTAPAPPQRAIPNVDYITIEPIMAFDMSYFPDLIKHTKPRWVWIGADSGHNDLPEPSWGKVERLIEGIRAAGIEVRIKPNLYRLKEATV